MKKVSTRPFFVFVFLILGALLRGQEFLELASEIDSGDKIIQEGKTFGISFRIETDFIDEFRVSGINEFDFAPIVEWPRAYRENIQTNSYIVRMRFRAKKGGRFLFGGLTVHTTEQDFKTDFKMIEIGQLHNKKLQVPLEFEWSVKPVRLRQREAFSGVIKICNHNSEAFKVDKIEFDSTTLLSSGALQINQFKGESHISVSSIAGHDLYTFEVAYFLITSIKDGEIVLPSGKVFGENFSGNFSQVKIYIEPLVQPDNEDEEIQIVGENIEYRYELSQEKFLANEKAILSILITGCGNLNLPVYLAPYSDYLELKNKKERCHYVASQSGYDGTVSFSWDIYASQSGEFKIKIPDLYWFNPKTNKTMRAKGATVLLTVMPEYESAFIDKQLRSLEVLDEDQIIRKTKPAICQQLGNYVLFVPIVLIYVVSAILLSIKKKRKALKSSSALLLIALAFILTSSKSEFKYLCEEAIYAYETRDFETALSYFKEALKEEPDNSALHYNMSVAYWYLDKEELAIYHSLQAIFYNPSASLYRKWNRELNFEYGLEYQHATPMPLEKDIFFFAFLSVLGISSILFFLWVVGRGKKLTLIFQILTVLCGILLVVLFCLQQFLLTRDLGVVRYADSGILMTPDKESKPLTEVKRGTTLLKIGEYNEYYIVKSLLGFEGWIEKDNLILLNDPEMGYLSR